MRGTSAECPGDGVSVTINKTLEVRQHTSIALMRVICAQNDRVLVEVLVRDLCILEQREPDDFSSNYQLSVSEHAKHTTAHTRLITYMLV